MTAKFTPATIPALLKSLPQPPEFPYMVRDNSGADCGARRTEADAIALAKRLQATSAAAGPYRVVRV